MCITVRGPGCPVHGVGCPGFLERPREIRSGLLPRLGPSRVESWRALSGGDQRVRVEHLYERLKSSAGGGCEYLCLEAERQNGAAPSHRRCYPGASLLSG